MIRVLLIGVVDGARNVTRHRVDRFDLSAKALFRACVHEHVRALIEQLFECRRIDAKAVVEPANEGCRGRTRLDPGAGRTRLARPLGEAAIEHGDAKVSGPPQKPPQTAGEHAGVLIVGDDLCGSVDTER
jgi:hypothetical protein